MRASQVFERLFAPGRQPRSDAYRLGVMHALRSSLDGVSGVCPYAIGSAECDAYYAGREEGADAARKHDGNAPRDAAPRVLARAWA